jgi:hypothetical protein
MTDVKEAVMAAEVYLRSFPGLLQLVSPRLEETEVDDNGNWLITSSFIDDPNSIQAALGGNPRRTYRQRGLSRCPS